MTDMKKIEQMFQQIGENMMKMNEKLDGLVMEITNIREENEILKEKLAKQDTRIEILERESRRKNIIIKGMVDQEREEEVEIKEKISGIMHKIGLDIDVNADIEQTRRLGKYNKEGKRPILVKLATENMKYRIFKNTKYLRGTEIWIDEDYTKSVLEERRLLIPQLKEARKEGKIAHLRYNKLVINNKVYETKVTEPEKEANSKQEGIGSSQKRTVLDRSPEKDSIESQSRKVTRTTWQKN